MKKSLKSKSKSGAGPKVDPYLEGLMSKLLERLVALERKMDTVIAQTAGKSSGNSGHSAPPSNPQVKQPERKERTLYEAICADCHKVCEVPFRPSEDRPVYCKQCFAARKSGGSGMPVLTSVVLPPRPVSKLGAPYVPPAAPQAAAKKAKKSAPAKKAKKKK